MGQCHFIASGFVEGCFAISPLEPVGLGGSLGQEEGAISSARPPRVFALGLSRRSCFPPFPLPLVKTMGLRI